MVNSQGKLQHLSWFDVVVHNDRFLGDLPHPDDGNFWPVNDWREVTPTNGTNVSNRHPSVTHVSSTELAVLSLSGVFANSVSNTEEAQTVSVLNVRNKETVVGVSGDPNVNVVTVVNLLVFHVNLGVEDRNSRIITAKALVM